VVAAQTVDRTLLEVLREPTACVRGFAACRAAPPGRTESEDVARAEETVVASDRSTDGHDVAVELHQTERLPVPLGPKVRRRRVEDVDETIDGDRSFDDRPELFDVVGVDGMDPVIDERHRLERRRWVRTDDDGDESSAETEPEAGS
jgi:hypothetical protein